jgi:hypothetical protein
MENMFKMKGNEAARRGSCAVAFEGTCTGHRKLCYQQLADVRERKAGGRFAQCEGQNRSTSWLEALAAN